MSRATRPVASREYKIMLRATEFGRGEKGILKAAAGFRETLARAVRESVIPIDGKVLSGGEFEPMKKKKQVKVKFFDTEDVRLRASDFVFRQRQPVGGGPLELTLKRRHPDRFFVSDSKTGGKKTKFEEDIKVTDTHDFISLHSLSGTAKKVDDDTKFATLKDIKQFFKPLKQQLGKVYQAGVELHKVGNFTANQMVLEGVGFEIGDDVRAECALIVWHQRGGGAEPVVVEFSFRYNDGNLGLKSEPFTKEMARHCFEILQEFRNAGSPLAEWVDLKGLTKTAHVYSLKSKT